MKFWTIIRITGWVSAIVGYVCAVICIYRATKHYAQSSLAGINTYDPANCAENCVQQAVASREMVLTVTLLGAITLLGVMYGIYKHMQPELDHITTLKLERE